MTSLRSWEDRFQHSVPKPWYSLFRVRGRHRVMTKLLHVAVGMAGHGLFDFFRGLITNAGAPVWWPMFCLSFDLVAAAHLGWLIRQREEAASKV